MLCGAPPRAPRSGDGGNRDEAPGPGVAGAPSRHDVDVTLLTCSVAADVAPAGAVDFRALAWRPSANGGAPDWVVPPLVEIIDYLEEEEFSALHTDSAAAQGLVTLAAARLLHLPSWAPGSGRAEGAGVARRPRRATPAPLPGLVLRPPRRGVRAEPAAARALVAAGVNPSRVTLLPGAPGDDVTAGRG